MSTSTEKSLPGRSRRLRWIAAAAALIALAAAYATFPRHADLAAFDTRAMAQAETSMWRHYYEKRYFALFYDLYDVARREYGFSPWDSFRIAFSAANAARLFQPSTSRAEAQAAIPSLVTYFSVLARAAPVPFDVDLAADTELAWWQQRRDAAPTDQVGATVARVLTLLYGVYNEDIRDAGILRAKAMEYRDAHAANMTEADWTAINEQLENAYALLRKGLSRRSSLAFSTHDPTIRMQRNR